MLESSSVWMVFGGVECWLTGMSSQKALSVGLCRIKWVTGGGGGDLGVAAGVSPPC
jgi:hypothetical protein